MQPILKQSNTVTGVEVLCFQDAEIRKIKSNSTSYAAAGPLSVLYFKDYHRFVLQLNDWRYPLMRRLPVISNSQGNEAIGSRSYYFPTLNGFTFELTLNGFSTHGITNFETILSNNSNFSFKGQENPMRKLEASPDDKLYRHIKKDTSTMNVISEAFKYVIENVKAKTETLKSGTININSRKAKVNLKSIKNKNFKKNAHSTLKKSFFESNENLTKEFWRLRSQNINNSQSRSIDDILKTSSLMAPTFYVNREEVEEAILNNKDLVNQGSYNLNLGKSGEHKGFIDSLKQGFTEIKDTIKTEIQGTSVSNSTVGQGPMEAHGHQSLLDKAKTEISGMVGQVRDLASDRSRDPRNHPTNPTTQINPMEHYSG